MQRQKSVSGLHPEVMQKIKDVLSQDQQVLVFLNRRGYAPAVICRACGHAEACHQCDKTMTYHKAEGQLRCHHCHHMQMMPADCAVCQTQDMLPMGFGTQRLVEKLGHLFPQTQIIQVDKDHCQNWQKTQAVLASVAQGRRQIIVGTQMMVKGHHFPNLTLAVIFDADQSLYSSDFRAIERLTQQVVQVSGRVGRAEGAQGQVYIQTLQPENPIWPLIMRQQYDKIMHYLLEQRKALQLPPYAFQAAYQTLDSTQAVGFEFLERVKALYEAAEDIQVMGPLPSFMLRKAGYYRILLIICAKSKAQLQRVLACQHPLITKLKHPRSLKWHLELDPQEF